MLSPAERHLSTLVGARVGWPPDVAVWPSLLRPDRVHEVHIAEYCTREQLDEAARRRVEQAALLELGAWDLDRARLAERELRRAAARRARSLAAFARARPAAALDRAPRELGAASEASRAARPAALTEVSEWAADEAAVALGRSPTGATRLLAQCVTLDQQLPATLGSAGSR